jgi:nucleotide-binding universal stress UspA family protein
MAASRQHRDAVGVTSNAGNSVVCGLDASAGARIALGVAARLADERGLRLVVVHVVQPQPSATGFGPTAGQLERLPLDALLAGGEALVDRILDEEQLSGVERRVLIGFPADSLADCADDVDAEFIVVGSRGRRGFKAAWLGSVSGDLIAVARRPVLVVPRASASANGSPSAPDPSAIGA